MPMVVPESWDLPEKILGRLGVQTAGRQRAISAEGHVLLVLHEVPRPREAERVAGLYWRNPLGEWRFAGRGNGLAPLREHLEAYRDAWDLLEGRYRDAACAQDYFGILEELTPIRRAARNLHGALQAARDAAPGDRNLIGLRDDAGSIERAIEILHDDTKNGLEFDMAKTAEEQARIGEQSVRAGHRLNIMAALFFPVTALASVFGMNLPTGLEQAPGWVTACVLGAGMVLGVVTVLWVIGNRPER